MSIVPQSHMPLSLNQMSIEELEAYDGPEVRVDSAELFESDDKWKLQGVPHYITSVTYRPTLMEGEPADYVSVESRIASESVLDLRIKQERVHGGSVRSLAQLIELGVEPGAQIVYNDGSTGIRQQLTYMLHSMGIIQVAEVPYHEVNVRNKVFTTYFQQWDSFDQKLETKDGEVYPEIRMRDLNNPLLIKVRQGLRVSDYTFDGRAVQTWYLS